MPKIYLQTSFQHHQAFRKSDRFSAKALQVRAQAQVFTFNMICPITLYFMEFNRYQSLVQRQTIRKYLFAVGQHQGIGKIP